MKLKALIQNLLLVYIAYMLCRIIYLFENWGAYSNTFSELSLWKVFSGGLLFDTSAIMYTNAVYALMLLLPLHWVEKRWWQRIARGYFIIVNSLAVIINIADAVYFTYTGHRTTTTVFGEFSNEGNLLTIFGKEMVGHWYLVIAGIAIIFLLARCYTEPCLQNMRKASPWHYVRYYVTNTLVLAAYAGLTVAGMRGGFTTAVRPITISNANKYVNHPTEAAMVLNTPFSLIRTIGKDVFFDPHYMSDSDMEALYSPVRNSKTEGTAQMPSVQKRKNVVVLIVESFGREYIGGYNKGFLEDGYKGYTPFVDELLEQSLSFDYTFANGRQSIDGMPSILSSIPRFIEPFFLTPASMNDISGIAGELGKCGYTSAFFHGAENGSMGFEAFAKATGFNEYYGRTEFNADKRFRGDMDYDGTWAIWDEPFLQFYATKMTEMKEPFCTAVFTASSHHPYAVPEEYQKKFTDDSNPIHKCIRYTDMALRRFFDTAKKQPWYKNTIFVLTSDHTNISDHREYQTDLGFFGAPILFFDPAGEMPRGRQHCIAQQIDIMPTILQYLGYNQPYVAFGIDILNTATEDTWAVNYTGSGMYQFVKGDYMIQFDGTKVVAIYDYKKDWLLQHNLLGTVDITAMEQELKAMIQSYMQRMTSNGLVHAQGRK